METITFNNIISSLIDERLERESRNIRDDAKDDYEKLKEIIDKEKIPIVDTKQEEFEKKIREEEKKPWSKLTKEIKNKLIEEYAKEKDIDCEELKMKINKRKIKAKDIEYDRVNEKIINVNIVE